jgi:hypothetical protein
MKMAAFLYVAPCSVVDDDVSKELTASVITLMMEAVCSSEISVSLRKITQHNI